MGASPRGRIEANATGVAGTIVTGIWLTALFAGFEWWLPLMLFCYLVVLPLVSYAAGDTDELDEWLGGWGPGWGDDRREREADRRGAAEPAEFATREGDDALVTLRDRYARGELTDEQFERKLDRLLDSETIEDVEDRRERERERAADRERARDRERE